MSIIGIDLGTTNSLVAHFHDGAPRIIPNSLKRNLTPSVVSVDGNGEMLIGEAARERLVTHPHNTVAAFKRRMGTSQEIALSKLRLRPEELSALVLKSLKADAEAFLGQRVSEAVISVPAYFSDAQRKATKTAGELAGLKVERLINEPTAAAIAYGLHASAAHSRFLVFDLGGGTFDVSVLELFEDLMEVHASAGDNFLGGEDFVDLLSAEALKQFGVKAKSLSPVELGRLRAAAENAKLTLSQADQAVLALELGGKRVECRISRTAFEELAFGLRERLRLPVERALRDAGLRASDLNAVVLAGGATRMPMIRSQVARMLGQFPTSHLNPDEVVALGAAVQAGLLARDGALGERVLTDVCPYTLGIETAVQTGSNEYLYGAFGPIIERNSVVPCSRSKQIVPLTDDQRSLKIRAYQGESRMVANNILLGELDLPLPRGKAETKAVDVRFSYDMNGILEVEATMLADGRKQRLVIEKNPGVLSRDEIEQRLKQMEGLKIHPRDSMQNRALLARGERLYEEALGDLRDEIGMRIRHFELAIEKQEPRAIDKARDEVTEFFDAIEKSWAT